MSMFPVASRYIVLVATAVGVFLIGVSRPLHGWDMIGYVASAYQLDGYRGHDLLSRTFSDVRADVDDDTFTILTQGEGRIERNYRETVHVDPIALTQQIPFYSIRIAYVELMRAVSLLGPNYSRSSYIISATFASLAVLL